MVTFLVIMFNQINSTISCTITDVTMSCIGRNCGWYDVGGKI